MSPPKLYLVANNSNPQISLLKYVQELRLEEKDLVVVFNKASSPLIDVFSRIDIVCFRSHSGGSNYFGIDKNYRINSKVRNAKKFFFLNKSEDKTLSKIVRQNKLKGKYELHIASKSVRGNSPPLTYRGFSTIFKGQHAPSTGFFYMHYFLKKYPGHVVHLLGFETVSESNWHPFKEEKEVIRKLFEKSWIVCK
jgi:hypothetical protein